MKHAKVTTYEEQEDGSIKATTESYFEELSSRKQDIIQHKKTDWNNLLPDVVSCLDVIKQRKTRDLVIRISLNELNNPYAIVKEYTVKKESDRKR